MAKLLSRQLFVTRLSFYTTNQELKKLFSRFGSVTEAKLVIDEKTQRPKGFGFVTFKSEDEARNALKAMNGRVSISRLLIINGRLIFVEMAQTAPPGE
ncbi:small RNA-binding protein 11, chloroplastic isoform X1 [Daucus carota subsp. sativus]|uniref:small RNA-binding protein 11, chloroplastic isoform X1 n=1 Tax=Daucus carota subsp. sativus TaxID=79200 RepID=UPI0007EF4ADE|nr:PREDICTED: glycine-rich RNA-binding protein 4, mitochondrial-like isoform X1 [Daucus carota subsp. sativus]